MVPTTKSDISGFSLTELMVVIGLMSILLTFTFINFNTWLKKYSIENQAREMMADLSNLRMRAIQTKCNHVALLSASATKMTFRSYSSEEPVTLTTGTQVFGKSLKYPISRNAASAVACGDIGFTSRGYTQDFQVGGSFISNQTIYIQTAETGATIDCLAISDYRINLGKRNGTKCLYQ